MSKHRQGSEKKVGVEITPPNSKGNPTPFRIEASHRDINESDFPLPPAEYFAGYEKLLPGATERCFAMWEGETAHRQMMERERFEEEKKDREAIREINKAESQTSRRLAVSSQWITGTVMVAALGFGSWLISKGMQTEGLVAVVTPFFLAGGAKLLSTFSGSSKQVAPSAQAAPPSTVPQKRK